MCSHGHGEALAGLFVKRLHENSPANQSISFLLRTRSWAYENCILVTHIPPVALTLNWFLVVLPMPSLPQGVKAVVRGLALASAVTHWDTAPVLSRASSYEPFNLCAGGNCDSPLFTDDEGETWPGPETCQVHRVSDRREFKS